MLQFDGANRLKGLVYTQPNSANLPAYSWQFDAAGRITQFTSPDGTAAYGYDDTRSGNGDRLLCRKPQC